MFIHCPYHVRCAQLALLLSGLLALTGSGFAATYYIDADGGSDGSSGTSEGEAWASLERASAEGYSPGDRILLQRGDRFTGKLLLVAQDGTAESPIEVASYGDGPLPLIDASGYLAGVHIRDSRHIVVRDLEITGDGGAMVDGSPENYRYGVYVDCSNSGRINHITIDGLYLHDIYPDIGTSHEGATPTTHVGTAIGINGRDRELSTDIIVRNNHIERVGFKAIELKWVSFVEVLDNDMKDIGGPAIQPGRVNDLVVRGNVVDGSGSFIDSRMHGRGSGIWPWSCDRVLIEQNTFMHARGRADSCGIHIDFNCRDVIVQYNLSIDNAGGFIEILGNNFNCTYRYNVSINDGSRVKGVVDQGTIPNNGDGHVIWISGYVGSANAPKGPTNSYLYNNTIYVREDIDATFSVADTAYGLLVANNLFFLEQTAGDITADSRDNYDQAMVDHVVWQNNLYQRADIIPVFYRDVDAEPSFTDAHPIVGDPLFANRGGLSAEDYLPQASNLVVDRGIFIQKLPDDAIGLLPGLGLSQDFLGNPIIGLPDIGAFELGGTPIPLPDAAFEQVPQPAGPDSVVMEAVAGAYTTEYYFTELSGSYGGDDSGWQEDPVYLDEGLLPNTTYRYSVTLRNSLDEAGAASGVEEVTLPARSPFVPPIILEEDFSSTPHPINETVPFPIDTWYIAYELQAQDRSVAITDGAMRLGWGYDTITVLWHTDHSWIPSTDYRLSGGWEIANTLDVHLGCIVGIGEFDPVTGSLITRIKEQAFGELISPSIGQSGTFSIDLSADELAAAGISRSSFIGVYFEHPGSPDPGRNDVYLVDNLLLQLVGSYVDSDMDGIPDSAETELGLDPSVAADGSEDWDGDLRSNRHEFMSGTDLEDPADFLRVDLSLSQESLEILFPGAGVLPGRIYILDCSQDLNFWIAIGVVDGEVMVPAGDPLFTLETPDDPAFYRLRIEWK